jgi:hypothetical protein
MAHNPILYIEELNRFPLRHRRAPVPGCAHVYLGRGGRLYCPAGGLTAGELWWIGPRLVYGVDVTAHPFELTVEVSPEAGGHPVDVDVDVDVAEFWSHQATPLGLAQSML